MSGGRGRWVVALSRGLFDPRLRVAWFAGSATLLAALLGIDWLARGWGLPGFAPAAEDLWLATGLGAALGAVGVGLERFQLTRRRAVHLAFHRAALPERLTWKHQRGNLLENGWFFLLFVALLGWCAYFWVYPLGPLLAANAVVAVGNLRLAAGFRAELASRQHTEPRHCT